jgi:hypothetical protein
VDWIGKRGGLVVGCENESKWFCLVQKRTCEDLEERALNTTDTKAVFLLEEEYAEI